MQLLWIGVGAGVGYVYGFGAAWLLGAWFGYLASLVLEAFLLSPSDTTESSRTLPSAQLRVHLTHLELDDVRLPLHDLSWEHRNSSLVLRSEGDEIRIPDVPSLSTSLTKFLKTHRRRGERRHGEGRNEVPEALR